MTSTSPVIVETLDAKKGKVGSLTLNSEKTLNSLTLEMVQLITKSLKEWAEDDDIAVILLKGAGKKAFCAGGDVHKLYESSISVKKGPREYAEQFFCEEYQLNYLIHTYAKPIVCLGTGIVMGGGLGLMAGASHRVCNEHSMIAMPEITIGLFPDVGGTWFLNRVPYGLGIFLALTGATLNARDAKFTNFADYIVETESLAKLEEKLVKQAWLKDLSKNHEALTKLIQSLEVEHRGIERAYPSEIIAYRALLSEACQKHSLGEIMDALESLDLDTKWYNRALKTMKAGSPLSAVLIYEQLRRHRYASLEEIFASELTLGTNIVRHTEFAEGVRALLIDKDKNPAWQHSHFSEVTASELESFFKPPWPAAENPFYSK